MKLIDWQFYPTWRSGYASFKDKEYGFTDYWICIGPLQMRLRK